MKSTTHIKNLLCLALAIGFAWQSSSFMQPAFGQQSDGKKSKAMQIADVPEGITSFGGAVIGDRVFIYGGHTGDAHSYYESGQNKKLFSIDLNSPKEWKEEGAGLGLQGLAMVAHDGKLYRLGGFHAHNKKGDKHDLRSVDDFAIFDFEKRQWQKLEPMPEPRSSFDAVVKDGVIFVIGGWAMNGQQNTVWSETAFSFDLNKKDAKWEKLPNPPFKRRALSVGFQGDQIVAIGGMQQKGGPTNQVALFDLKTKKWSEGPALPKKGRMEGFGTSCFNVGGKLVVSTYGGNVYQLDDKISNWLPLKQLDEGRFFHRLLPIGKDQFALIGGASMESGKFYEVEVRNVK